MTSPDVTLSVVSHGQALMIRHLLSDIQRGVDCSFEIILTLNLPEDESFLDAFKDLPIHVIRNASPKGFGANHNAAFVASRGGHFVVVNPDIRARDFSLLPLLFALNRSRVGACGPVVLSASGSVEDSARRFPSLWRLTQRIVGRIGKRKRAPDYSWHDGSINVDWLAGMFVMFHRDAFKEIRGFDERFFMYMEDADICRRLRVNGWEIRLCPETTVIHDAQRASRRSLKHMKWHVRSAFRYLTGM